MLKLGVNIDHVATIRQARQTDEPDPVWAAVLAELGGADLITVHLREDRRHIQDRDVRLLTDTVAVPLNLEMAMVEEMVELACQIQPYEVTLVPERREEVTTEGGLDVLGNRDRLTSVIKRLQDAGMVVALFVDPNEATITESRAIGADAVELHTGAFALSDPGPEQENQWQSLMAASHGTLSQGLRLHVGHGLTYRNVRQVARLTGVEEFHIGHSIVSRAVLVGMERAVREMRLLLE